MLANAAHKQTDKRNGKSPERKREGEGEKGRHAVGVVSVINTIFAIQLQWQQINTSGNRNRNMRWNFWQTINL